jgi:[ribosomal protein S5]-alanine N-acetyltransferase
LSVIETERLTLREISEADAAFILELLNDPDFKRNIADRGVRTIEAARLYIFEKFVESRRRQGFGFWLVETRESQEAAGICGLVERETLPGIDVGYAFLPQFRSKGYAYEAAAATAGYARDALGLRRLYGVVNPDNAGSIRVLEKLGMRFERMVRLSPEGPEIKLFAADL